MRASFHLVLILAYLVGSAWVVGLLSYGEVEPTEIEPSPRISMEFQEADIRDVLKVLAQQAELNFVIAPEVRERRITLFLRDVSIEEALDAIMEAAGLAYEWVGKDCIIKELELKNKEGG